MAPTASRATADTTAVVSTTPISTGENVSTRRIKKRELDRRCQRMARERTKARIAYLEGLVEGFRSQDSSGQVTSLMQQLDQMAKERDAFAKTLKLIEASIQSHKSSELQNKIDPPPSFSRPPLLDSTNPYDTRTDEIPVTNVGPSPADFNDMNLYDNFRQDHAMVSYSSNQITSCVSILPSHVDGADIDRGWSFSPIIATNQEDPIIPRTQDSCACSQPVETTGVDSRINYWRFANQTLSRRSELSPAMFQLEDYFGNDTHVRAMIEGWGAVEHRWSGSLPPLLQKLRVIDEVLMSRLPLPERLGIMTIMHLLIRFHEDPSPIRRARLPSWYLKRPSQSIAHSYAIDFFPWPGARERFIFYQHRYCDNLFWDLFSVCLRLRWPYQFQDCYSLNTETGHYRISQVFQERILDINAWAMTSTIFNHWPEFYCDIPSYDSLPRSLDPPSLSDHPTVEIQGTHLPTDSRQNHNISSKMFSTTASAEDSEDSSSYPDNNPSLEDTHQLTYLPPYPSNAFGYNQISSDDSIMLPLQYTTPLGTLTY